MVSFDLWGLPAGTGRISVNGRQIGSGEWQIVDGVSKNFVDPVSGRVLLTAMQRGSRLDVNIAGRSAAFGLQGSSEAISTLLAACQNGGAGQTVAAEGSAYKRFPNEATMLFPDPGDPFDVFSRTNNADIWGGDIRSGLDDPLLRGMTERQCAALCQVTENCGAYTWNDRDGDVCFLKTGQGRMVGYQGAISGTLMGSPTRLPPPPTRGPEPVIDESVAWRDNDTEASHTARVRAAAAPLGRSCEAERADLAALSESIELAIPSRRARVGEPFVLEWWGNDLIERIPVWVMASTPAPVRFDGNGFFALGPESPNPFGIAPGKGETRALVALWARGAGTSGKIQLLPLQAGETPVTMRLVAYLRACQEEVVLEQEIRTLDVAPAPAELVVGTPASRADLTHAFDVPKFDRRVELNETRLRISVLSDGTEIVERAGSDVSTSPSGRFVTFKVGGDTGIIDILDGTTLSVVPSLVEHWASSDTYFISSTVPWAKIYIVPTYGGKPLVWDQVTGPSCCPAISNDSAQGGQINVDIENAAVVAAGPYGHRVASLLNPEIMNADNRGSAHGSIEVFSEAFLASVMGGFGTVSPVAAFNGESVAGGLEYAVRSPNEIRLHSVFGRRIVEVDPYSLESKSPLPPRDLSGPPTFDINELAHARTAPFGSFAEPFERIGMPVQRGTLSEELTPSLKVGMEGYFVDGDQTEAIAESERLAPAVHAEISAWARSKGIEIRWQEDPGLGGVKECNHFSTTWDASAEFEDAKTDFAYFLPKEIDISLKLQADNAPVYVLRASCVGGATLGTLRGSTSLMVFDFEKSDAGTGTNQFVVADHGYYGNTRVEQFFTPNFSARLIGRFLVLYAPRSGQISVYDRQARDFSWINEETPNGDLMRDIAFTTDGRHVVQINSDGGFHVHRIEDGETVLHGRIVEDEIAVWTDDFRFDATAEAASLIDLRFPGLDGQFSLDRFDPLLYVPGLAAKVLAGETLPEVGELAVPPDISGEIELDGGDIVARIDVDPSRGASELRLYQDGVHTHTSPLETSPIGGEVRAARLPGTRYASVVAASADGLVSLPVSADLGPAAPGGTRRMLAVGVDLYADPGLPDLNFAKADADRMMGAIMDLPETVPAFEEPRFVGGRRAGPDDVLSAIDDLIDGLGASDHAVLFFAGHGVQGEDGAFYMAMHDTDLDDLAGTALPWTEVARRLSETHSRITILIDACHSGAASGDVLASNDGAVAGLSAVRSNVTILAASKGRQLSQEATGPDDRTGGGLFSLALREVLVDAREGFDTNGNGRIEASELSAGVAARVSERTRGQQVPWMTKGRIVGDHAMF